MKKVLLISNYKKNVGGISGQVDLLYNYLNKEDGFSADIFNTTGSYVQRLKSFFNLYKIGKNYDVFHIHGCSYRGFFPVIIGVTVGRKLKKNMIVSYHGGDGDNFFKKYTRFVKYFLLKTNKNIVLSGFLAEVFDKYSIPYIVIPNILKFDKNQYIERKIINPNFISVRALNKEYNIECIIRAFQIVVKKLPEATLSILGGGALREYLESLVKEEQIPNIYFKGRVKNTDIYHYLLKADVFLSSPLVDNQPVSILEAYNAGLLVISSNVGGVPYMLEDKKTGLLFESENYEDLAEKILFAIENQEQTKEMIHAAHCELEKYSWGVIKDKLLLLY